MYLNHVNLLPNLAIPGDDSLQNTLKLPTLPIWPIITITVLIDLALALLLIVIAFTVVLGFFFSIALRDTGRIFKEALEETWQEMKRDDGAK